MTRKRNDEESRTNTVSAGRVSPGAFVAAEALFPPAGPSPFLIRLSVTDETLAIGSTVEVTAVVRDQFNAVMTGRTPAWVSTDEAVATVDVAGLVTAVGNGSCYIYATDGEARSNQLLVVVGATATLAIAKTSGDSQSATVGSALTNPLTVTVTQGGSPVANSVVTWGASDGFIVSTSTTNASGVATADFELGTLAGTYTVTATCATGSSVTFTATGTAAAAASIEAFSSTNQSLTAGDDVTDKPSVVVKDAYGNPKSGVTVTFAVASGGGSGTTLTPSTDSSGIATVGSWTTGASAGTNTMTATAAGLSGSPVTFTAVGAAVGAGPITQINTQSGTGQTGIVAGQAATAFSWKVADASVVGVEGALVTFAVTAGGGSLSAASGTTDASGIVSVTLTTGTTAGVNTVVASVVAGDGSTKTSSISTTTTFGTATKLGIVTQPPSNTTSGDALTSQPVIEILDANDNRVTTSTATVGCSVHAGSNATLSPSSPSAVAVAGVASFSGLVIFDQDGGASTLDFASSGLTGVTSSSITVAPPVPAQLQMVLQPAGAPVNSSFSATVGVYDDVGTLVTGSTATITVALTTPGGATLSGTLTKNASSGVATFSGLSIDTAGTYTLTFSSSGLTSVTSTSFTITAASTLTPNLPSGLTLHHDVDLSGVTLNTPISTLVSAGQAAGNMGITYDGTGGANMRVQTISDQSWRNSFHDVIPADPAGYDRIHVCQFGTASGAAYTINAGEKGRYLMNLPANTRSLYVAGRYLISSNYYGQSGSGDWKKIYVRTQTEGPFVLSFKGATTANIRATAYVGAHTTNITGATDTTLTEAIDFNQMLVMQRNQWYNIEFLIVGESSSNAGDAHMTAWVNGTKYFQITACRLTTGAGGNLYMIPSCYVLHYYGGGGTTSVPANTGPLAVITGDHMQIWTSTSRVAVP